MLHVVSCSGGKDSVCSVIMLHKYHPELQLLILISEVMFSLKDGISGENPEHIMWIKQVMIPTFESWGYSCKIIRAEGKDYLSEFHHVVTGAKKYPEHNGRPYGFPICDKGRCMIKRDLKVRPMERFLKSLQEPYIQYLGIAADEPMRLKSLADNQRSILADIGITEQEAWNICRQRDLLSPVYRYSYRQGCFMCANAKREEQAYVKRNMPDVWKRFVGLERNKDICYDKWSLFGTSLAERDAEI